MNNTNDEQLRVVNRHTARLMCNLEDVDCPATIRNAVRSTLMAIREEVIIVDGDYEVIWNNHAPKLLEDLEDIDCKSIYYNEIMHELNWLLSDLLAIEESA